MSHWESPAEGEVGRKGMSCERTFPVMSSRKDLEEKVFADLRLLDVHIKVFSSLDIPFNAIFKSNSSRDHGSSAVAYFLCWLGSRVGRSLGR